MKHTIFIFIFSLIFNFSARAQYLDISTPGMATIQYDHAQGIASFVFPMEEIPIEWPAEVTECIVLPDYSEQVCIVSEKYIDGVPLMWVYAIRGYAEIHIPSLGAVYTTGNRSDVLLAPKPNCYLHLIEAHLVD
jgi:hypothetical protein